MKLMCALFAVLAPWAFSIATSAAEAAPNDAGALDTEVALVAGLIQPIFMQGGNVEVDVRLNRFVVSYSHGWSLNLRGEMLVGPARTQQLAYHLPYSTGFGVGYQISRRLDVRVEPKLHRFDLYYEGSPRTADNRIVSYQTLSVGLGAYYKYRPFEKTSGVARGVLLSGSVRFWPRWWSSLDGDRFEYNNARSGMREVHDASEIGIANSPLDPEHQRGLRLWRRPDPVS